MYLNLVIFEPLLVLFRIRHNQTVLDRLRSVEDASQFGLDRAPLVCSGSTLILRVPRYTLYKQPTEEVIYSFQ